MISWPFRQTSRPVIGITQPSRFTNPDFLAVACAVWLAGGRPRILTHRYPDPFPEIHGLILGGGRDIFPPFFREIRKKGYQYDFDRDAMEMTYLGYAETHALPVLGICRGAQLINVFHNGTLHMKLKASFRHSHYPSHPLRQAVFRKPIQISTASMLHRIIKTSSCRVNSLHSQAINEVGDGLVVAARESNGMIQAIEDPSADFLLGVQFHPELLIHRRPFRRLFGSFVAAAARFRDQQHFRVS
ncbi:gamma-glutamyl-gamma-aminobutyrate hydrolase family protein [Spirochaeta africana]|uniref:Putative glutamine amidotransferase n=1 Tax=Spirochaeta africana (strain ATCC 700263 / DSM 8902 / Z-7692) TaxID=889378 RepID=H9UJ30_SPIAZ|nr:type 1 glutamine amidotransferase [Spirochaeta africana]AFG37523.1 putative glutamine amidotransferase [Spirochaeta africana DSM 8902]